MTSTTSNLRVGGMLIGYYVLCPRKAWLSMRGIWMEQESDTVALGRLLDEHSYDRDEKHLTIEAEAPDGTGLVGKIDRANLRNGVLHETKKGRSCEESHVWQLRFYLWMLRLNGVTRADGSPDRNAAPSSLRFRGQLDYPLLRRTEAVTLEPDHETTLANYVQNIRQLAEQETPPDRLTKRSFCAKCAYEELCYG